MSSVETHSVTHNVFIPLSNNRSQSVNDRFVDDCIIARLDLVQRGTEMSYLVLEPPQKRESEAQIANQRKAERLTKYLQDLEVTTDDLDPQEVAAVSEAWAELYRWSNQCLKVPKVGFGNEEGCVFVWENERIYFELEFVDGLVEFFTRSEVPGEAEKTRLAEDFATMEDFLKSQHASNLLAAFSID